MSSFAVFEVSAEFVMDIAKQIASSPHPLDKESIFNSFKVSKVYATSAISECLQLGLIVEKDNRFIAGDKYRDLLKRSERSQLFLVLHEALLSYPPFLLYIDFITKGYSSEQSSWMTSGIFTISSPKDRIEKMFRNWGIKASLIISKDDKLVVPEGEKGLPNEYVENLMKALRAELQAKIFLIETLSPSVYKYIVEKGIDIDDLSDALVSYEKDPKASINKSTQVFEHFLFTFGQDVGANITKGNGIIQFADTIKTEKPDTLLIKQKHLCYGIGGLRLMAHHDPDKETSKQWFFTPQGAIIAALLTPTTIRSIYLYHSEKKQEF